MQMPFAKSPPRAAEQRGDVHPLSVGLAAVEPRAPHQTPVCTRGNADLQTRSVSAAAPALKPGLSLDDVPRRLACEMHDAVTQTLFAANLLAGTLARSQHADAAVRSQAQMLQRLNSSALAEMRLMLFELRPESVAQVRLCELLQQSVAALAGRGSVLVNTDIDDTAALAPAQRLHVYRIAQAALSNIGRHSGASHGFVQWVAPQRGAAVLRISDNGIGFVTGAEPPAHAGLAHMKARAQLLHAELAIRSAPGEGTQITLTLNRSENEP